MNISLTRTKAETALTEQFERIASSLPGNDDIAAARKQAIGTFASLGFPHRRIEEWKYTDLRQALRDVGVAGVASGREVSDAAIKSGLGPLADVDAHRLVFVDDHYRAELSSEGLPAGVQFRSLASTLADGSFDAGDVAMRAGPSATGLISLNAALMTDGALLEIDDGAKVEKPILVVVAVSDPEARWTSLRSRIGVGADAEVTIVEAAVLLDGAAAGQRNDLVEIDVGDRAAVTHVIAGLQADTSGVVNVVATTGEEANYRPFFFNAGPALTRNQLALRFDGEGGKLDCSGAFLGRGSSHVDNTLIIDHAVPGCESRELFKGVLEDRARGVFQGKVIVRQVAQKTDGKQMAQALMLSDDAEFDSKPELEIYADDVACGHGSTCAELDPDHVYYLRARGIPEATARGLLVEAFVAEAIEKVEHDEIAVALGEFARGWFNRRVG